MTAPSSPPPAVARRPIVWIGTGISVAFLYLFLRGVAWSELEASLAAAHYVYLIPALALWFATLFIRAVRWKIMVRHMKPISMDSLVRLHEHRLHGDRPLAGPHWRIRARRGAGQEGEAERLERICDDRRRADLRPAVRDLLHGPGSALCPRRRRTCRDDEETPLLRRRPSAGSSSRQRLSSCSCAPGPIA